MSTELLTINEIRDQLNCATSTIYRWIDQDAFPKPVKIGGMARWTREDLEVFLSNAVKRRNDPGPRPCGIRRGRKTHSRNKPRKKD